MSTPNEEQIEYWDATRGALWVAEQETLDRLIGPAGQLALAQASVRAGERVLDVGCGCGTTSLELGRRVGPGGRVLGIDVSRPMLARASERAREAGLAQVEFRRADAQTAELEPDFDVLFSRMGVMFFADPPAAFANLHRAMRPGARLAFVCWRALADNPWMYLPLQAISSIVPPLPPPDPHAPGPLALADAARTQQILESSGWRDVRCEAESVELEIPSERGVEQAVEFMMNLGPTGRALESASETERARAAEAMADALRPFQSSSGLHMQGGVWIVSALA